jgi:hypothetical protein
MVQVHSSQQSLRNNLLEFEMLIDFGLRMRIMGKY